MGQERRFFTRKSVSVDGTLSWVGRGRLGGKKAKSADVRTLDLSVDGARLTIAPSADVAFCQMCEITFADQSSQAIVRDVIDKADGTKVLCIQLHQPSSEFLRVIDRWLSASNESHRQLQHEWLQERG